jgi:DNA polymerase-3 subunit epsilon
LPAPLPSATAEETECVLRWLETPGTRLVEITGTWTLPAHGAPGLLTLVTDVEDNLRAARPFDDRRALRPAR